jgi:hypothetical protein
MALEPMFQYGTRFMMELEGGETLHNFSTCSSLLPTFPSVSTSIFEEEEQVPKMDEYGYQDHLHPSTISLSFSYLELSICFK